jgi:hypothetical protein
VRSSIKRCRGVDSSAYTQALQGILTGGETPTPSQDLSMAAASRPASANSLAANQGEHALPRTALQRGNLNNE